MSRFGRMLSDKEKKYLREVLKFMPEKDLYMLALTVTNSMIRPITIEEAMDAILLHSATPESVLLRKRLSREVLFRYLHNNKVPMIPTSDKRTMISKILQMWNCNVPDNETMASTVPDQNSIMASHETTTPKPGIQICEVDSHETATPKPDIQICEVDEMAHQFTRWFYSMLNQHEVHSQGAQLGTEHFWQDCNMRLVINSEMDSHRLEVKNSAANVVQLIWDTKTQHNLYFNPNLSHEGVQGKTDVHGLVMVLVCGTLHQQDKCVGVFEQLFGLIRDPSACNNWKIKYTELNLKSKSIVTSLPTLAEGSLLNSVSSLSDSIHSAKNSH